MQHKYSHRERALIRSGGYNLIHELGEIIEDMKLPDRDLISDMFNSVLDNIYEKLSERLSKWD